MYMEKVASYGFPRDGKDATKVITGMTLWDHSENCLSTLLEMANG